MTDEQRKYQREWRRNDRQLHPEKYTSESRRLYYAKNKEKLAGKQRVWRRKNPERAREISRTSNEKYRRLSNDDYRASALEYARRLRFRAYLALGNKCTRCGFEDHRAFQIDHVNSDGGKERKAGRQVNSVYHEIIDSPEQARLKYQLLCANCNQIMKWERGEAGRPGKYQLKEGAGGVTPMGRVLTGRWGF